jgi:hypothetical protein
MQAGAAPKEPPPGFRIRLHQQRAVGNLPLPVWRTQLTGPLSAGRRAAPRRPSELARRRAV